MQTEPLSVCEHLAPCCERLRESGAVVLAHDTGWTECKLNVVYSRGPSVAEMQAHWNLPAHLEPWSNRDPHYAIENGLFCAQCKIGLSWPHVG